LTAFLPLFANNILPILLIAAVGFVIQRIFNLDPRPLSQTVFNVFTPALVFRLLYLTPMNAHQIGQMGILAMASMLLVGAAAWLIARALRLPPRMAAAFLLVSMFPNAGNYGLSLTDFAFGNEALAWSSVFFIVSSMAINSLGVYIATVGRSSPGQALKGLLRVPAVYAIPLGLLFRYAQLELPAPLWRPIELLSDATIPSMIIILGLQISKATFPRENGLLPIALGLRLLFSPAIAFVLVRLMGFQGPALQASLIEAAMPTAVLTSVLALEFDVEPDFVSGTILASTLLSPLTITPLLAILGA
jgi:hypothetical protein